MRRLFVRSGLTRQRMAELDNLGMRRRGPFEAHERIFRVGDRFRALYVLVTGTVKTEVATREGDLQITGFYLPGEPFGMEAIGGSTYPVDAVAVEKTWVCELPFARLEALCACLPALQHEIFGLLGEQIRSVGHQRLLVRNLPAQQRILWFLKQLQERVSSRLGEKARQIRLPMPKEDIANFLSLAPETLSRNLIRLERAGVIRNNVRSVELFDTPEPAPESARGTG